MGDPARQRNQSSRGFAVSLFRIQPIRYPGKTQIEKLCPWRGVIEVANASLRILSELETASEKLLSEHQPGSLIQMLLQSDTDEEHQPGSVVRRLLRSDADEQA